VSVHQLTTALAIAHQAYHGLKDYGGMPLLAHALRVTASVAHLGDRAMIVALLHDAVEDCPAITLETIQQVFGDEIAADIDALTHKPQETYLEYIARVVKRGGIALGVKRADNLDNSDPRRLAGLVDGLRTRLEKKYADARILLF